MRTFPTLLLLPLLAWPALAQETPSAASSTDPAVQVLAPPPSAVVSVVPAPEESHTPLQLALAFLERDPIFTDAAVSMQVVNTRTGDPVYGWGENRPLVPASVMKLLTTATALRFLGPDYRFPTWVLHDGDLGGDGVLAGNLYVKGQGDPTMVVERMWRMVLDLKLRGVREIKGDVVFDESYFADTSSIPGWNKEEDIESGPTYFSTLGALSVNYNIAAIVVRPGTAVGQPAVAEFEAPSPVIVIDNRVTTGSRGSRKWIKVERATDEETHRIATYTLTGNMPAEHEPDTIYRTLVDPLGNYMGVFESLAREQGLKVRGKYRAGITAAGATLLLKAESAPLADVVALTSKHSNNFMAEQMLRVAGAERHGLPATTAKGVDLIAEYLGTLGVPAGDYALVNGSGLTREGVLRPSVVNAVLVDMWRDADLGPEFASSLSVGGRDGTLWSRFRDQTMAGRVRGKTGTLSGVTCLAGYVTAMDGETYAFTFLVNEVDGALARARRAHDGLVLTLAGVTGNVADSVEAEP